MPLINCKGEFSLGWYEKCILSNAGNVATMTDAKLCYFKNWRQYKIIKFSKQRI